VKSSPKSSAALPAEYRRVRRQLGEVGWVALGSLVERTKPGQGGPRYQWSRRVGRKTVTVALSSEQFRWLKTAIANQRKAWDLLSRLQSLTVQFMWKNLPASPRRKRLTKKTLGLN
jgi:hypothetical protein